MIARHYPVLVAGFLTLPTAYVTGNPVECVVHPDLWNRSQLWDPLAIGRASLAPGPRTDNLEDEYVEESYGAPINTVNKHLPRFLCPNLLFSFLLCT